MKTSQLVLALAALMVMVFAITFAMNFLGGDSSQAIDTRGTTTGTVEKNLPQIEFETTEFPVGKNVATEWELNHPGHADFWFSNPNKSEVKVGLLSRSCKCTQVDLFLSNPEWNAWRERSVQLRSATAVTGAIAGLFLKRQEADMENRESQLTRHSFTERDDPGVPVPPGGKGWFRVSWTAEKRGGSSDSDKAQLLKVEVWMNHKNSGMVQPLEVRLVLFPILRLLDVKETAGTLLPAKAPQQLALPTLNIRDLPRTVNLFFGSATRAKLDLKAEADKHNSQDGKGTDAFVVGVPELLSRVETEQFQAEVQDGPLMAVYRLPITLMDKVGDKLFDTGMFRRQVRLTVNDGEIDPLVIPVGGIVEGDVIVGGPDDNGRLTMGAFNRAIAKTSDITLSTEVENLNLELDKSRTPAFLKAELKKIKQPPGTSRRTWKLSVTIEPGKVSGPFPRDDHPVYRDAAVYVKAVGATTRLIRIPVEGNAENR